MNATSPLFDLWINGMVSMAVIGVVDCGLAFYVFRRKSAISWLLIALFLAIILWIATFPLYSPGFRDIIADRQNGVTENKQTDNSDPFPASVVPEP